MFPWVRDWTNPQNHLRFETNVKKMKHKEWLWFHPSAYKLIYYGSPIMNIIIFTNVTAWFYFYEKFAFAIFFALMDLLFIYDIFRKIRKRKLIRDMNLYDVFMRDYPDEK